MDNQFKLKNLKINVISDYAKSFALNQFFAYIPSKEISDSYPSESAIFDNLFKNAFDELSLEERIKSFEMHIHDIYDELPLQEVISMIVECAQSAQAMIEYSSEAKNGNKVSKIRAINQMMVYSNRIFESLPAMDKDFCLNFSQEGKSLNHCLRWGEKASEELLEKFQESESAF